MEEPRAKEWLAETFNVSRETLERLSAFRELLATESLQQNLVSRSSLEFFWSRHVADSAQLLLHRPSTMTSWLDLGAGAGFPGLVVAALHDGRATLVEERKLRAEFLGRGAQLLGVAAKTEIICSKVERISPRPFDVISARAFAPLDKLLALGMPFSTGKTRWILPKGRNAQLELEAAESSWQGSFRLEPSLTDPEARIIVAEEVRPRGKGKRS